MILKTIDIVMVRVSDKRGQLTHTYIVYKSTQRLKHKDFNK